MANGSLLQVRTKFAVCLGLSTLHALWHDKTGVKATMSDRWEHDSFVHSTGSGTTACRPAGCIGMWQLSIQLQGQTYLHMHIMQDAVHAGQLLYSLSRMQITLACRP